MSLVRHLSLASVFFVVLVAVAFGEEPKPVPVGSEFEGVVTDSDGAAVAGATVYLRKSPKGSVTLPVKVMERTTDPEGQFAFDELENGPYRVWAETDSQTSLQKKLGGLRLNVKAGVDGPAKPVALSLHPGCGYDVSILDAETKEPIQEATVEFGWTDIARSYTTDETGVAKVRNLAVDNWYFIIRADGYATEFKRTSEQKLGSVLPVKFELGPGGTLIGTVKDQDGNPVAGARVYCSGEKIAMSPNYARVNTNENGGFRVDGLPLTSGLRLRVSKVGYDNTYESVSVVSASPPTRQEFTLKKLPYGGDVRIKVVDKQGRPISGAAVLNGGRSSSQKREAKTDADGVCELKNVFAMHQNREQAEVTVQAKGFRAQAVRVEPGPKGEPREHTVVVEPGKTLFGKLLTPDLDPAAGVRVYFDHGENGDELGGRVETDKEGRFTIDGLGDSTVLTVYLPNGFAPIKKREVVVVEEELAIVLEVAGVIRLRAVNADNGERIPEFNVKIGFCRETKPGDPSPGGINSQLINPGVNVQGTAKEYLLDNQIVGVPYKVIVSAEGYESKELARVVTVSGPDAKLQDVALKPSNPEDYQTVAGQLLDADGKPIVGAAVRLVVGNAIPEAKFDPRSRRSTMTGWRFYHWDLLRRDDLENRDQCKQYLKTVSDANGRFEFKGVSRLAPWLEVFYTGKDLMSQRYSNLRDYDDSELLDLELTAERPATVTVTLLSFDPDEIGAVRLQADDYSRGVNTTKLAYSYESISPEPGQRSIVFRNLPSGAYSVAVTAKPVERRENGTRMQSIKTLKLKPLTVEEGAEATVEF